MDDDELRASVEVHLSECRYALEALIDLHCAAGSVFGPERPGDDQAGAIWELSGYALAQGRAYLSLLEGGFVPASAVQGRVMHEALVALVGVTVPGSDALSSYLADRGVKAETARRDTQELQRQAEEQIGTSGPDLRNLALSIYKGLSGYAHNGRSAVRECISEPPVSFAYGPHPSIYRVASHVGLASLQFVHLAY